MILLHEFREEQYPETSDTRCLQLTIPNDISFLAMVLQLLSILGNEDSYVGDDEELAAAHAKSWRDANAMAAWEDCNLTVLPVGTIVQYGTVIPPDKWLICDGSSVLKSEYPLLWAVLGDFWGEPTETTFVLPDYRNRSPMGYDNGSVPPLFAFGSYQGNLEHTLSEEELPAHTHPTYATETGTEFKVISAASADVDLDNVDTNFKTYPTGGNAPHTILHSVAVSAVIIYAGE